MVLLTAAYLLWMAACFFSLTVQIRHILSILREKPILHMSVIDYAAQDLVNEL